MTVFSTGGADEGRVFMPLLLFLLSSPSLLFVLDVSLSSKVSSFTASLQADLSLARVFGEFVSMFMDFR